MHHLHRRGSIFLGGGHDEKEQTLNQLLAELDGFDPSGGIVLLAATNRPEILDPALLRADRCDRQILLDRTDKKGRADVLNVHLKKICTQATAAAIDLAMKTQVDAAYTRAIAILEANRPLLDRAAGELLTQETFGDDDLATLRRAVVPMAGDGPAIRTAAREAAGA